MIAQNYPQGYIGSVNVGLINPIQETQVSSSNDVVEAPTRTVQRTNTSAVKKLVRRLNDVQDLLNNPNLSPDVQRQLRNEKSRIEAQIRKEKTYTVEVKDAPTQTPRDVVITDQGGVSKAYELQTPEEKTATATYTATLQTTQSGTKRLDFEAPQSYVDVQMRNPMDSTVPRVASSQETAYTQNQGLVDYTYLNSKPISLGQEALAQFKRGDAIGVSSGVALGATSFFIGTGKGVLGTVEFVSPYSITQQKFQVPIVTPTIDFIKAVPSIPQYVKTEPFEFAGTLAGGVVGAKLLTGAGTGVKNVYVASGSRYVPEADVFSSQVLTQGKTFPEVSSTSKALSQFGESNIVVTSSPGKIKGNVAGESSKSILGLEDPGIFVTPKGEASPAFLKIGSESYSISFNPLKNVGSSLDIPTVTEFQVKGVLKQPRSVVNEPGFNPTRTFFESKGGESGFAFITKRSELGQGELNPQVYKLPSGKLSREKGTSELEAVVPLGAKFEYTGGNSFIAKFKGFEEYTSYKGVNVPLRRAVVIAEEATPDIGVLDSGISKGRTRGSDYSLTRDIGNVEYITPLDLSRTLYGSSSSIASQKSSSKSSDDSSSVSIKSSQYSIVSDPSIKSSASKVSKVSTPSILSSTYSPSIVSPPITPSDSSLPTPSILSDPIIPRDGSTPKPRIPPVKKPDLLKFSFNDSKKKKRVRAEVRKKGQFKLVGEFDDVAIAQDVAIREVRGSASASYRLSDDRGQVLDIMAPQGFNKSKREKGVIIQPNKDRISSLGEKIEIPGASRRNLTGNKRKLL